MIDLKIGETNSLDGDLMLASNSGLFREDLVKVYTILESLSTFLEAEGITSTIACYKYNITIPTDLMYGKYDQILFDIPKQDLPLHINDHDPIHRAIIKWRLHHNF